MRPLFARLLLLSAVTLTTTARAQPATVTWVVAPVALADQVSSETTLRAGELLASALGSRPELALAPEQREAGAPDLTAARTALAAGRDAYQKFQFTASRRELERAADVIERAGVPPGETATLIEALIELATVEETSGDHATAALTCEALMVIRPDVTLDPVRVSPRVVQTCEAARQRRSGSARRVTFTSTPPFKQLYVDGQPLGAEPLTVTLPVGTHYLFGVGHDQQTLAQRIDVEAGSEPQALRLTLPEAPAHALTEALRARLRRRGPLPQTLEAARALATVTGVERVIVGGLERDGSDHWRLWAAALDTHHHTAPVVAVARLADDLLDAPAVLAKVAEALVGPRAHAGLTRAADVSPTVETLDFGSALFGAPPPSAAVAIAPDPHALHDRARPHKKFVWLWIGGAVVVAGAGLAVGLALGLDNGKLRIWW